MNFQVLTCLCLASSAASLNPLDIIPGNVVTKNSQLITFSPGRDNIPKAARSATILYAAPAKKSYSPFGGTKPFAPAADPLYCPPGTSSSAPNESFSEHAETDGAGLGSYLDVLGGTGSASMKKSYSPFGGSKPVAAASADSWYSPPATEPYAVDGSQSESYAFTEHAEPNGAGLGSYHDILGGTGSVSMKKSYSPFGGSKPVAAASADSWYSPPATESSAPVESIPVDDSHDATYESVTEPVETNVARLGSKLEVLGGSGFVSMKKSYSPFGGSKPVAAGPANPLYSPPATVSKAPVSISEITKEVPKQVRKAITLQQRRTLKVTGPQSAEVSRVVPPPAKPSVDDDHRDLVNSVMAGGLLFLAVVVFLAQPW